MNKYICGINEKTFDLLFSDNFNVSKEKRGSMHFYNIIDTIEVCTLFPQIDFVSMKQNYPQFFYAYREILLKNLQIDISKLNFENIYYDSRVNHMLYRDKECIIYFDLFSRYIKDDAFRNFLESGDRYGECHSVSPMIVKSINNSKLVTGRCHCGKEDVLHTVVEVKYNGEDIIIDSTKNLCMFKDDFIRLHQFEVLQEITREDYLRDMKSDFFSKVDFENPKIYLSFRDDLVNDIKYKEKKYGKFIN